MIPANLSLVPLSKECRAAMQAIAEVERKLERGACIAEFAYARAFFRILNGRKPGHKRRISAGFLRE